MVLTRLRMDELVNAWVGDRNTPFQMGLLAVFDTGPFLRADGSVDLRAVAAELARRAATVPALRRRVVWTRPGEGRPAWVEDPTFDATRHITITQVHPADDLPTWAANRCLRTVDLQRPLWRADVVGGLAQDRVAVLVVVHHVLADGLEGMRLLTSLLDPAPDAVRAVPPTPEVARLPTHRTLVLDRLASWRLPRRERYRRSGRREGGIHRAMAEYREAMADFAVPPARTSLPRDVGPLRRMAVASVDLAPLSAAGHRLGATVNDLVLAAVAQGLRDLLSARGECHDGLPLRVILPVATDPSGQAAGMIIVDLPVGEPDPRHRLSSIVEQTTERKARLRATGGTGNGILGLPVPLARIVIPWARRRGSAKVHLSVTNVPGPQEPLWFAGARMLEAVPVAPLVPLVGLTVGALSYAGRLVVAVNADASVVDLDLLGSGVSSSLAAFTDDRL